MEDIIKPEDILRDECARASHHNMWLREPRQESPWYSESEKAHYDVSIPKQTKTSKKVLLVRSIKKWAVSQYTNKHRCNTRFAFKSVISSELMAAIEKSRSILQLQDDWDGEGSPGYSEVTWKRAIQFLLRNVLQYWRNHKVWVHAPKILNGPYGSIDILWQMPNRKLLVNIPASTEELAGYYGSDKEGDIIKGKFETTVNNEWILMWLMK